MKKYVLLFIVSIVLFACKTKEETVYTEVPVLRASALYNDDKVYHYIQMYKDVNKEMANSYLQKSTEVENENLDKAIYYVKRAITLHPTFDNYKTLLGLLSKNENYSEMQALCSFLIHRAYIEKPDKNYLDTLLFGPPSEEVFYEYLVSQYAQYGYLYGQDSYFAAENGFDLPKIKQQFFADKRIKIDMASEQGKALLFLFMTEEELDAYNKLNNTFKNFLAAAENNSPVFEINRDNIWQFNYDEFNGRNNEDYDNEAAWQQRFSYLYKKHLKETQENPDTWVDFNLKHFIDINENVKAVVYSVDSSENACPIEMRHIYYRLVTYDTAATIIDSKIIASQNGEQFVTANFNTDKFTITTQNRVWKKTYNKRDFDNYISATEKIKEERFQIQSDGKITAHEAANAAL